MRALIVVAVALGLAQPALGQEKVSFSSNDTDLTRGKPTHLEGLLYRPDGEGPFSAIVLMHGCGGLYDRGGGVTARHDEWARRFRKLDYVVLHVDSFTPRGEHEICTQKGRKIAPGRERARDAYGALLFLQGLSFVRPDRIGLMGWSNGGSTTLWTILDPVSARPKTLTHGDFRAAIAFYPGCRAPLEYRDGWKTQIPLLVLTGENDDWTPASSCRALADKAAALNMPFTLHVYPDAHHGFDAPNSPLRVLRNIATTASGTATTGTDPQARADAIERAPAFFARHLKP